jgi:hypothetical protein
METAARFSLLHGSAVFFLTQEAGASKAIVHVLSLLYKDGGEATRSGNRTNFAESHLIKTMEDQGNGMPF